ncbi:MAG: hypothetical protein EOL95_09190 [Bacteroidia bacterium]|nr:hypothetical protein [Bacteroidia bacterium]
MNISTVKAEISAVMHGTTMNNIVYPYGIFNRASRQLIQDIDLYETKKTVSLGTIYNGVYQYALPVDLKGNKIIDIKPQSNRNNAIFIQQFGQTFDISKDIATNKFNIKSDSGVKSIQISAPCLLPPTVITNASNISGNGTWAGTVTDIRNNSINFVKNSSIEFDITGATPTIYNETLTAIDLSEHEDQSSLFYYVYVPNVSSLTSVTFKWGSSSSDYWTCTSTTTQENTEFQNGWNLIKCNWDSATEVGTPDSTAVNYVSITLNTDGTAQTGCKINYITSNLGQILEAEYYSSYFFRDSVTGAFKETVTSDEDLINLETENINLFIYLVASYSSQQILGKNASYDVSYYEAKYLNALIKYQATNKSEFQKVSQPYYKIRKPFRK